MTPWRERKKGLLSGAECQGELSHGPEAGGPLPAHTVRESSRARHVRLVLSPRTGLEVVVPKGFDRDLIPAILQRRAAWVRRVTARFEAQGRTAASRAVLPAPDELQLRAIGERWQVEYRRTASARVVARVSPGCRVIVSGDIDDSEAVRAALSRWLARRAREAFVPWLEDLAHDRGFVHGPITIRSQRTRWASCSGKKGISVNLRLLFLPEELVTYVFMHELCHTVRMDHSRAFWTLVGKFEPEYKSKKRRLKEGWKFIPAWLEPDKAASLF